MRSSPVPPPGNGRNAAGVWQTGSKVLLVSDDPEVSGIWGFALRQLGLEPVETRSAAQALQAWSEDVFDLVIIDVFGPDLDGVGLARRLRQEAANPILLLTSEREEPHVLDAYKAGVDECIVKPVSPSLFLAKVRAWLRRSWTIPANAVEGIQAGPLLLDPGRRSVTLEGGPTVKLTNLEFRLLHLLMSHRGQVLPTQIILDRVWGYHGSGDPTLLKNVIYRLRRKIEPDPRRPRYLQTAPGQGYVLHPR